MEVKDFINGNVTYDREGQYFWINTPEQGMQMLGELRGWGHIQNMFKDKKGNIDADAAGKFQDEVGEWVADAINKKMAGQPPEMVKTDCTLCFGTGDYKRAGMIGVMECPSCEGRGHFLIQKKDGTKQSQV